MSTPFQGKGRVRFVPYEPKTILKTMGLKGLQAIPNVGPRMGKVLETELEELNQAGMR